MGKRRKPSKLASSPDALIFSGDEDEEDYKTFSKMGFVCMEEISGEEAKKYLSEVASKPKPNFLEPSKKKAKKTKKNLVANISSNQDEQNVEQVDLKPEDLPSWRKYPLDDRLLLGLKRLKFIKPTPVQKRSLDAFYSVECGKDILGSAPTGSGKTLAFGLPIINHILKNESDDYKGPVALIVVPTRELALQIRDHLVSVTSEIFKLRLVTLIGGMSAEKQDRQLSSNPNIIIGTPGRLLDCIETDKNLQKSLSNLPFFVIDEADRLVESGHFKELDGILAYVQGDVTWKQRITFLFSATLDFEASNSNQSVNHSKKIKGPLEQLRSKIRFCTLSPVHVSLSTKTGLASGLSLSKIYAIPEEKDLFLVYYLLSNQNFSKVLLFVNSIDILKRVQPVLEVFNFPVTTLHAQMQQRQRLQHLDKFKAAPRMILVTSDVSARGLDIPSVDLVVHYHLPTSVDTFVHRCGRTARAQRQGSALALIAPQEVTIEKSINKSLSLPNGIPEAQLDLQSVDSIVELVELARKIETLQSQLNKQIKEQSWEAKAAAELGVDFDDDIGRGKKQKKKQRHGDDDGHEVNRQFKLQKSQLASLKASFAELRKTLRL